MIWIMTVVAVALYIIGVIIGRAYEKFHFMEYVVGVLAEVNKETQEVESITYYYTDEAYDAEIKKIKELGEEFYE